MPGGAGASTFGDSSGQEPNLPAADDLLMTLDRWVEQGTAPDTIVAARVTGSVVVRTGAPCAHRKTTVYPGQRQHR